MNKAQRALINELGQLIDGVDSFAAGPGMKASSSLSTDAAMSNELLKRALSDIDPKKLREALITFGKEQKANQ